MSPRDSPLARWNPTLKLGTLLVASSVAMLVTDPVTPVVLWSLAVTAAFTVGRVTVRALALTHLALLGFAVSVLVGNVLLRHQGPVVAVVGPVEVTAGALEIAVSLAVRTLFLGVVSVVLVATTDPVRLMTSLHQHARVPAGATYAVLAGMRVLEELPARWETIRCAQAVRDPRRAPGALPARCPRWAPRRSRSWSRPCDAPSASPSRWSHGAWVRVRGPSRDP
ncbi:hypothetical protein GCM10025865_27900 [Paraoerskovia sediminicola]|uniref:Energy-coupling factor transporter transmembrane protein EcfT n=1 Tax=Paraoerskovia sediminicola TaxID=1138587 RepID=A0ABN6XF91_9CELL|nr:energy-coupling factor transporter transmembrane component T [Paraoerskovia sediminicola]BDZ43491.1 hypothetical protein GCM10025865_27900 [Paraoerskovia sediminicola]